MEKKKSSRFKSIIIYNLPNRITIQELQFLLAFDYGDQIATDFQVSNYQPRLYILSFLIKTSNKKLQSIFLGGNFCLKGQRASAVEYKGINTEDEINRVVRPRIVYFKGIPKNPQFSTILETITSVSEKIEQVHIPKNIYNQYRHFGYIVCKTAADKEAFYKAKNIRTKRFKLTFVKLKDETVRNYDEL